MPCELFGHLMGLQPLSNPEGCPWPLTWSRSYWLPPPLLSHTHDHSYFLGDTDVESTAVMTKPPINVFSSLPSLETFVLTEVYAHCSSTHQHSSFPGVDTLPDVRGAPHVGQKFADALLTCSRLHRHILPRLPATKQRSRKGWSPAPLF